MIDEQRFYQRKSFWIGVVLAFLALLNLIAFWGEISLLLKTARGFLQLILAPQGAAIPPWGDIFRAIGVLFFAFVIGFWLIFNQSLDAALAFILPIQERQQRVELRQRFFYHLRHRDSPTIFVKDGKSGATPEELESDAPGVVFVHANSAVALEMRNQPRPAASKNDGVENRKARSRIVGSGVAFTRQAEIVRGSVDLRTQIRAKSGVLAYTLDGIEVETSVNTIFTLGQPPDAVMVTYCGDPEFTFKLVYLEELPATQEHPAQKIVRLEEWLNPEEVRVLFGYFRRVAGATPAANLSVQSRPKSFSGLKPDFNKERVFNAIFHQPLEDGGHVADWSELPAEYSANIFRNLLSRENYDELYNPNAQNRIALDELKLKFSRLMQIEGILSYQLVMRTDGVLMESDQVWDEGSVLRYPVQEFKSGRFLRDCGIKILSSGFGELTPTSEVIRKQRLEYWQAHWHKEIEIARANNERQANQIRNQARAEAQQEMILRLSKILNETHYSQEVTILRLFQALESMASEPTVHELLPKDMINILNNLRPFFLPDEGTPDNPEG